MKSKLKIRNRQSGKTYKPIGKMFKQHSKNNQTVMLVTSNNAAKSIGHRIVVGNGIVLSEKIHNYKDWKLVLTNKKIDTLLLDEFDYFKKKDLKAILKFADKNSIKVIGYSSKKEIENV